MHPLDPSSPDAANLRRLGDRLRASSDRYLSGLGSSEALMRTMAGRAAEFSLDLGRYWSHSINFAADRYLYGNDTKIVCRRLEFHAPSQTVSEIDVSGGKGKDGVVSPALAAAAGPDGRGSPFRVDVAADPGTPGADGAMATPGARATRVARF